MPPAQYRTWLENFIKETEQFPNGQHDDQVDALSIVLDVLAEHPYGEADFHVDPLTVEDSLLKQINHTVITPMTHSEMASTGVGQTHS